MNRVLLVAVMATLPALTCTDSGQLPSPTVRVPLASRLPLKAQRQYAAADTSYECSRKAKVQGMGASQDFTVTWRLYNAGDDQRYITAVQVDPNGPFQGGRGPRASASVGVTKGKAVPVLIRWRATKGCSGIEAKTTVTLRTDDPACKPPRPAGKIFSQ